MSAIVLKGMKDVVKALDRVERKTRYATAEAINKTALDLQQFTVGRILPSAFTLRKSWAKMKANGKPATKFGIKIKPFASVSKQGKDLHAIVGSEADWLAEQEQAGIKTRPKSLSIPTKLLRDWEKVVPRKVKAKRLVERFEKQKKMKVRGQWVFPLTRKKGGTYEPIVNINGNKGIWVRTKQNKIRMLYMFRRSARLVNKVRYNDKSLRHINRTWARYFDRAMAAEFATGKPAI